MQSWPVRRFLYQTGSKLPKANVSWDDTLAAPAPDPSPKFDPINRIMALFQGWKTHPTNKTKDLKILIWSVERKLSTSPSCGFTIRNKLYSRLFFQDPYINIRKSYYQQSQRWWVNKFPSGPCWLPWWLPPNGRACNNWRQQPGNHNCKKVV